MSYLEDKILTKNDHVVNNVEKNKIVIILAWVWGVLGCFLLLIPTIMAIKKTIEFHCTEFVITDKKVIEKYGVLNIQIDEMAIEKIENITINCTFWGRIFNYGDVYIQGTNRNNVNFYAIKNPYEIKKQLSELVDSKVNGEITK